MFGALEPAQYTVYVGLFQPWASSAPNRAARIRVNGTVVAASQRIGGTDTIVTYAGQSPDAAGKLNVNLAPTTANDKLGTAARQSQRRHPRSSDRGCFSVCGDRCNGRPDRARGRRTFRGLLRRPPGRELRDDCSGGRIYDNHRVPRPRGVWHHVETDIVLIHGVLPDPRYRVRFFLEK